MNLVLAITGASGAAACEILMRKSSWPISLVASDWGKDVCAREWGPFETLAAKAQCVLDNRDLSGSIASGTTPSAGMVILPCSTNTLGKIAHGIADCLITRAAHCHMKERRPLVLCVRETPWTKIDFQNAAEVTAAGATVMPICPPFYMFAGRPAAEVTAEQLLEAYVDHVLAVLGQPAQKHWGNREL